MENQAVSELVKRVANGDTQAYEELFLKTKDNVYFHALTALLNEESAWDVVQDTYTAAYRSITQLKAPDKAETWLCALAGNLCYSRLRRRHSVPGEQGDRLAPENGGELAALVEKRLRALTDMQRMAVIFRYCDKITLAQIGTILRCGERDVNMLLADAERAMCLRRDTNEADTSDTLTPAKLKEGLSIIQSGARISLSITLSIAEDVAAKCAYESSLRIVSGAGREQKFSARNEADAIIAPVSKQERDKYNEPAARDARTGYNPRKSAMALASGLVVVGVVVGAMSINAVFEARRSLSDEPDNISSFISAQKSIMVDGAPAALSDEAEPRAVESGVSVEAAQAYIGVLSDYVGHYGVCSSSEGEKGVAYASLLDFDADGKQEMYLYYIDNAFSPENETYRYSSDGKERLCLHEELWQYDGALSLVFSQEHCAGASAEDGTGAARWLCESAAGGYDILTWYGFTDENGYINHSSKRYELINGALDKTEETAAMFVVANEAKHRRDGYLIEEYYGTDNAHFDDVAYFTEGAVITDSGRKAYNYEQCQAILDIGTADVVPLATFDAETPVVRLSEAYNARHRGVELISFTGSESEMRMSWSVNDVNAFLSTLADICTGNA